jgi:rubrerythrin
MQSLLQFMTDFQKKKTENLTGPQSFLTPPQGTDSTATRTASSPVGDFTNPNCVTMTSNATNTNVKISNYVMWDESTGAGKPKQGTETGSGVQAWAWFKRTNIPIRDAAVNMKGGLGLLAAYAITHNMQITLAAGMLNEPEVHPRPNMTESEINEWVKKDMEFKWFKTLPDEVFIKVMNRLYASVNPAPFFRLVIAADIPELKDGDLYYPVEEFQAHCDKWISTLSTLIKGGWAEGTTDLREVFLASISTCTLVHNQAKREKTEDVLRLIATLKKWIIVQDNDIQSAKAAKLAIKSKVKAKEATTPEETDKSFEKRVKALFTQMQGQKSEPKEQKASDTPEWQCNECGNKWQDTKARPHRCKKECIYSEHKDANKTGKPYPKGVPALSWKAYGQAYPAKQQAFFDRRDAALKGAGISKKL